MLFHFFTFSHFQILFSAMNASLKISAQTPYSLNQSHEDHLLIFFCPAFAFLELKEFYWSQQVPTTLILFQRVIGPSYVYICKNNGKYIYNVLVYNSMGRFGLCIHVQIICIFSFFFFLINQHLLYCLQDINMQSDI